jgi:hypothetical protein
MRSTPLKEGEYLPKAREASNGKFRVTDNAYGTTGVDRLYTLSLGATLQPLSEAQWDAYDQGALSSMLPSMAKGVSLVNFILELKDFKHLVKGREALIASFKRTIRRLKGKNREKSLIKLASEGVLLKEFAIDPFISDVSKIIKDLINLESRLAELIRRQGTPQTRHYSIPIEVSGVSPGRQYIASNLLGSYTWSGKVHQIWEFYAREYLLLPTYTATVRYTYRLNMEYITRTRVILDTLGVRLDPSILWNAIPFSFMVDWFVDIQGLLARFSTDNLGIDVSIEDFCSSVKSVVLFDYVAQHREQVQPYTAPWYYYGVAVPLGRVRTSHYERRTKVPSIFSALKTSGLSGREAFLTSAMYGAGAFSRTNK